MGKNIFTKGRIVVIKDNESMGNPEGSIVKVLSKPGEVSDRACAAIGKTHMIESEDQVMCEARSDLHRMSNIRFNNKPAYYHKLSSLRLAYSDEKKAYAKGIQHTNGVRYTLADAEAYCK